MSNKRTAAESNSNEGTDLVSQQENNAKRAKLASSNDTTLQGLPFELIGSILTKAIAMEVKDLKLAKSVWKEKADLVISRLKTVCSRWNSILTTDIFRNEIHRILDGTAEVTIRLETVRDNWIKREGCSHATTMGDEIFLLFEEDHVINVYNRIRFIRIARPKDVIHLPEAEPAFMEACSVSNCVYVGLRTDDYCLSVLRITKEEEHQFNISPWIQNHRLPISMISLSANGSLIILSFQEGVHPFVSIYNGNGSLQHEIKSPDIDSECYKAVLQKSNGNIVLAYVNFQDDKTTLLEFDTNGSVVRKYQSQLSEESVVIVADIHGRFMITEPFRRIELLDSEFNPLGIYSLQRDKGTCCALYDLHYESERNEIVRVHYDWRWRWKFLTIFRFTED